MELVQLEQDLMGNPKLGKIDTEIIGVIEMDGEVTYVNLIAIYDKSETSTISDKELKNLINNLQS